MSDGLFLQFYELLQRMFFGDAVPELWQVSFLNCLTLALLALMIVTLVRLVWSCLKAFLGR